MKYSAPDYEKVALLASDVFAAYNCPEDEYLYWSYTSPCEGSEDYRQVSSTYTGMGYTYACYSSETP